MARVCGFKWTERAYFGRKEVPGIRHDCWLPDGHEDEDPPVPHTCDNCGEEYDPSTEYHG